MKGPWSRTLRLRACRPFQALVGSSVSAYQDIGHDVQRQFLCQPTSISGYYSFHLSSGPSCRDSDIVSRHDLPETSSTASRKSFPCFCDLSDGPLKRKGPGASDPKDDLPRNSLRVSYHAQMPFWSCHGNYQNCQQMYPICRLTPRD